MILNLPQRMTLLRRSPFAPTVPKVRYPCQVEDSFLEAAKLTVTLPQGYRVAYSPRSQVVRGPLFSYNLTSSATEGVLNLIVQSTWKEGVLTTTDYPAAWERCGSTKAPGNARILLETLQVCKCWKC